MPDSCTFIWISFLRAVECSEALRLNLPVQAWQIWLFVCCYVFEWLYVWPVSCCFKAWPMIDRQNGWVFLRAAMAAVHFSPELLSEKPVTLLMINAPVRWAVSELQQTLNPDSQRASGPPNLRTATSVCPSTQQINGGLSTRGPVAASATAA